jgi:hypothetical protein
VVYGEDATDEIADVYKAGIDQAWNGSGPWEVDVDGKKYSVDFHVNVEKGDNNTSGDHGSVNYVKADSTIPKSTTQSGYKGNWRTEGRGRRTIEQDNPARHEFGHILGLKDRVDDGRWDDNIMGKNDGNVELRNITPIVNHILKQNESNGVINFPRGSIY